MVKRVRRKRRKVRWGRLLLLLLIMAGMVWGVVRGAAYAVQSFTPPAPPPKIVKPVSPYADKAGKRITLLLIGVDDSTNQSSVAKGQADALMLLSINPEDNSVNLLSIPRDTMVTLPGRQGVERLGQAYVYGGAELTMRTIEHALQVPIAYHAALSCQDFAQLVDLIGGVEIYVDQNMNYEDAYSDLKIHLNRGYQHLDGLQAGQYVKYRSDEMGDIGRMQRQQIFMKALAEQVFQLEIVTRLPDLWNHAGEYLKTDLTPSVAFKLLTALRSDSLSKMRVELLPGQAVSLEGQWYWKADEEHARQVVNELFYANNGK